MMIDAGSRCPSGPVEFLLASRMKTLGGEVLSLVRMTSPANVEHVLMDIEDELVELKLTKDRSKGLLPPAAKKTKRKSKDTKRTA